MRQVWIPALFYDDHAWRDLPTPVAQRRSGRRVLVALDDPALPELLSDARHYAHGLGPDCPEVANICRSAKLTVRRINEAQECVST